MFLSTTQPQCSAYAKKIPHTLWVNQAKNTLNCSSEHINTLCGILGFGAGAASFFTAMGSGKGRFAPSRTHMLMTGAPCLRWISLPIWTLSGISLRFSEGGIAIVKTKMAPLLVPAHKVADISWAMGWLGTVFVPGIQCKFQWSSIQLNNLVLN